jgi:predicted nucleotidyltransferase
VLPLLLPDIIALDSQMSTAQLYLFGSILKLGVPFINDIDILVISDSQQAIEHIKAVLGVVSHHFPIHVTYMSSSEESQFDFIRQQNAKRVNDLAA